VVITQVLGITMGNGNVAIGYQSLYAISSSVGSSPFNVALGFQAGRNLTTGQGNIAIGGRAGYSIGAGSDNIYMGQDVGLGATTRTLSNNISLGKQSLTSNVSASRNIAIGFNSLANTGVTASGD
jgi:trimeric autotransporter adhesin